MQTSLVKEELDIPDNLDGDDDNDDSDTIKFNYKKYVNLRNTIEDNVYLDTFDNDTSIDRNDQLIDNDSNSNLSSSNELENESSMEVDKSKNKENFSKNDKNRCKRFCAKCDTIVDNVQMTTQEFCINCESALIYICTYCNKKCDSYIKIWKHVRYYCQVRAKVYKCPNCKKNYRKSEKFQLHIKLCKTELSYHCSFCIYKCKRAPNLTRHLKIHVLSGELVDDPNDYNIIFKIKGLSSIIRLFCSKCNKIKDLKSCKKKCRECKTKLCMKCLKCNHMFDDFDSVTRHLKSHDKEKKQCKHHCLLCEFTTNSTELYNTHKQEKHYGIEFKYLKTCWKCKSKFGSAYNLGMHLKICGNQLTYLCDKCPFEMSSRLNFLNHLNTHLTTAEKKDISVSYKLHCSKCKESTLQNSYQSILKCKKCNTEMSYECPNCNMLYNKYYKMMIHLQNYCLYEPSTYDQQILKKNNLYFCDYCPYKTSRKNFLKTHIKFHTIYKDYFTYERVNYTLSEKAMTLEQYCSKCNKLYTPTVRKKVKCKICKQPLIHRCIMCETKKDTYREIYHHIRHKCLPKEVFHCSKCDFKATISRVIARHIRNYHFKHKSYLCPKCHTKLKNSESFRGHLKFCGMQPNLFCNDCPFKTKYKLDLKKHIIIHHLAKDTT